MKTFKDLEFKPHPNMPDDFNAIQALIQFDNGYGASVIQGPYFYTRGKDEYELAVLDLSGELIYTTSVTDDVLGHLSEEQVTEKLIEIQKLPAKGPKKPELNLGQKLVMDELLKPNYLYSIIRENKYAFDKWKELSILERIYYRITFRKADFLISQIKEFRKSQPDGELIKFPKLKGEDDGDKQ